MKQILEPINCIVGSFLPINEIFFHGSSYIAFSDLTKKMTSIIYHNKDINGIKIYKYSLIIEGEQYISIFDYRTNQTVTTFALGDEFEYINGMI